MELTIKLLNSDENSKKLIGKYYDINNIPTLQGNIHWYWLTKNNMAHVLTLLHII